MNRFVYYSLLISILNSSGLFAQSTVAVQTIRNNKVTHELFYQKAYKKGKLTYSDSAIVHFDSHGYDTLMVNSYGREVRTNSYDSSGRLAKRISYFDNGGKSDSSVYKYQPDSSFEIHTFYYDTTINATIKMFNRRGQEVKSFVPKTGHVVETAYDSLGRKTSITWIQSTGKKFIQKEFQTLDSKGRLHIHNKLAWGGGYEVYEYYDNGLLKSIKMYSDKGKTIWREYISIWYYYK